MSSRSKRVTASLAITGQTQSVAMPLVMGRVDHLIVTSDTPDQTFNLEILNEKGDSIWGGTGSGDIQPPRNDIRPDLLPTGQMTMRVTNPVPASGNVTFVAILEEK